MHDHSFHAIEVAEVTRETDQAVSMSFHIPPPLRATFAYSPGQFVTVRRRINGIVRRRCYSLCSSPQAGEPLRIAIKRVDGGLVSNDLCSAVKPGDTIEMQPPAGNFVPSTLEGSFLLLAAGSGITPIFSILKSALATGRGRVTLLYANRDEQSVIFKGVIAALAADHPSRFVALHWLESVQGLPGSTLLREWMKPWVGAQSFICGPGPFMTAVGQALSSLDVREQVHIERFVSLPDEVDAAQAPIVADGRAAALRVLLEGRTYDINWLPETKLLDVMLEAGLDAPFSCRVGGCSACMCRVKSGGVRMAANLALSDAEIAEGWTLACQSYASSDAVEIEIA